ncbi:MAG: hypothetical protein IKU59_06245 [Bacteroidales bacterium]|nr:hypothetical protein [Bacteroidales bacterium]MBR5532885.1 hypothetical protein [Bacteroidales bacterium]
MKLLVKRKFLGNHYTIGALYIDGKYFCDTLEDRVVDVDKSGKFEGDEIKVAGKSAIPYGEYKVILNRSPKFGRMLPRLVDVPHFEGILIHRGNSASDTSGCILVGENSVKGKLCNSSLYEEILVMECKAAINRGENITVKIEEA